MMKKAFFLVMTVILSSCSTHKPMWSYVVPNYVTKGYQDREAGKPIHLENKPTQNMKVVYNDGATVTEVYVPIISSGQRVYIKHNEKPSKHSVPVIPDVPTKADETIEDSYVSSGYTINAKSQAISITKTGERIRNLADKGQYERALHYAEQLLTRYPHHVPTLRAKGSLLLKIGENKAALKAYEQAQQLEPDNQVAKQINTLRKSQINRF